MSGAAACLPAAGAAALGAPAASPAPRIEQRILIGHSGARVVLHSDGRGNFVRKTAASHDSSARLRAQAQKQHALWMCAMPFPRVLRQAQDGDGRATFDMDYIPGRSAADAVLQAASIDTARLVGAVARMMDFFALACGDALPARLFADKIAEVLDRSRARFARTGLAAPLQAAAAALAARDWSGIPASPCHGDLSLDNILLSAGGSVAFIDCDAPWVSSFWLDFGKLFQDIEGHWCMRALYGADASPVQRANALQKLEQLGSAFRPLAASVDAALPPRLSQLAALSLFRAIPYAPDAEVIAFLCGRISHMLEA